MIRQGKQTYGSHCRRARGDRGRWLSRMAMLEGEFERGKATKVPSWQSARVRILRYTDPDRHPHIDKAR